jgi:hypothetical protein
MNKNSTNPLKGLASIAPRDEKKAAKQLFQMVTEEWGSIDELKNRVTRQSLLELIFLVLDIQKRTRSVANQEKSNEAASLQRLIAKRKLDTWLDKNIGDYKGRLNTCADDAINAIRDLGRGPSWVRKEITAYNKRKK